MTVNTNDIDKLITAVEKSYGKSKIHKGSETQRIARIPFNSVELNMATGGGIPIGRFTRFYGDYSSGKSLNALHLIRNAQNINIIAQQMIDSNVDGVKQQGELLLEMFPDGMKVALYNVEQSYDQLFADEIGVDTSDLYVIEASIIEEIGTIIEAGLGSIHLHIVDSVTAAVPLDAAEADITDWQRGLNTRVWNKVFDHIEPKVDNSENSVVLIDQVRVDMMSGAEKAPGGKRIGHVSSMTLHFKRGKWLFKKEDGSFKTEAPQNAKTMSGQAEADGFEINARVAKCKVGRPFRTARLQFDFEKVGFDINAELAKAAVFLGLVEVSGSWYKLPSGDSIQGKAKLAEKIKEDIDFKKQIQDKVYDYVWRNP